MEMETKEVRKELPNLADCKDKLISALQTAPIGSFNMRYFSFNVLKRPLGPNSRYLTDVIYWIDGIEEIPFYLKEVLEQDARHPIQQRLNSNIERYRKELVRKDERKNASNANNTAKDASDAAKAEVAAANDLVRESREKAKAAKAEAKRLAEEAKAVRREQIAQRKAEKEEHEQKYRFREQLKLELVREYLLALQNDPKLSLMRWRENLSNEDQYLIGYQSLLLCYNNNKERIIKELEEQQAFEAKRLADEAERQRLEAEAEAKRIADEEAARLAAEEEARAAERAAIAKANAEAMVQAMKDAGLFDSIMQVEEANSLAKENRDKIVNNVSPAVSRLERQVQVLKAWVAALMKQAGYKFPATIETGERIDYSKDPSIST